MRLGACSEKAAHLFLLKALPLNESWLLPLTTRKNEALAHKGLISVPIRTTLETGLVHKSRPATARSMEHAMIPGEALPWWILTALLVVAELATGTFFLLMLALGAVAAALAAHLGVGFSAQLLVAALAGGGGVALWHHRRKRQPAAPHVQENPDALLDIGSRVQVDAWQENGTARITYRGSAWGARWTGTGAPQTGELVIRRIEDNCLLLDR